MGFESEKIYLYFDCQCVEIKKALVGLSEKEWKNCSNSF